MVDFGYDISDFKDVDSTFGTMRDLEELIAQAKKLGIKVKLICFVFFFRLLSFDKLKKGTIFLIILTGDFGFGSKSHF